MMRISMGYGIALATFLAAAILTPKPTMAQAAPQADHWTVDIGLGGCTLSRNLSASPKAILSLQTLPGSDAYDLAIATEQPLRTSNGERVSIGLRFDDGTAIDRQGTVDKLPHDQGSIIRVAGLDKALLDALAKSSSVDVSARSNKVGPLALGKSASAVTAFDKCMTDQLIEWGADPAAFLPGGTAPVATSDRDTWVPDKALLTMKITSDALDARFSLTIDQSGTIDGCKRLEDAKDNVETVACGAVMSRHLFKPALDPTGKPVRGAAAFRIQLFRRPNIG